MIITIEQICDEAREIPCAPSLLPRLMEVLKREDAALHDLEDLITQDPGLSAAMLKVANSAYFSGGNTFDTVQDAIFRLGLKETYRLAVSVSAGRWGAREVEGYSWEPGDFCRHSFAVAVSSELVARETDSCSPDVAYTAGLMHDAGKLALAFVAGRELEKVWAVVQEKRCAWLEAEKEVFGFHHADVSKALLERWKFPENLLAVASCYANPGQAPQAYASLVRSVHTGKHLAIQTGIGVGEDAFWTNLDSSCVDLLGLDEESLRDLVPPLMARLEKMLRQNLVTGLPHFD